MSNRFQDGRNALRELSGRVAVVTGGASGIGRAVAICLGNAGMSVVVADIRDEALADVAAELDARGVPHIATHVDVSDSSSVDRLRDISIDRFGAVHVVHNNAGVALPP